MNGLAGSPWDAAQLAQRLRVEDGEVEPELLAISSRHFRSAPAGHTTIMSARAVPQQQLLRDQARLDRLAEADVVGEQQVHARHRQRARHRGRAGRSSIATPDRNGACRVLVSALARSPDRTASRKAASRWGSSKPSIMTAGSFVADTTSRPGSISHTTVRSLPRSSSLTLLNVTSVRPGSSDGRQFVDGLTATAHVRYHPLLAADANKLADLGLVECCRHGDDVIGPGR